MIAREPQDGKQLSRVIVTAGVRCCSGRVGCEISSAAGYARLVGDAVARVQMNDFSAHVESERSETGCYRVEKSLRSIFFSRKICAG